MGNTEITLNGTDWSNLYHIDYHGGCGGELLMGIANLSSDYIRIFDNKGEDSAYGFVAIGTIPDNISIAHIPEKTIANLTDDEYRYVVKALLNLRTTYDWYNVFSRKHVYHYNLDPINDNWQSDKNFLLRTHDERKNYTSLFPNCKSLRLYSSIDTWHLIKYMMFKKQIMVKYTGNLSQWILNGSNQKIASRYMSTRTFLRRLEWESIVRLQKYNTPAADRYMSTRTFLYTWEWESIVRFQKYITFEEYMLDKFTPREALHEQFKESVNAADWVFGLNTERVIEQIQDTYKTIITEEKKKAISEWQHKNVSMLTDNGLSLSSSPNDIQTKLIEECTQLK